MGEGKVESHNMGATFYQLTSLSSHVNRPSHSWDTTFSNFDLEKPKVKVMVEVKVNSHKVGVTSYRLASLLFHVNRPSHSWDTAFSKFDLENPGQGHGWGGHWNWKSQHGSNILSTHIPLIPSCPCQSAIPFLRYMTFSKFDLENPRSRSWVRVNPSSSFRDMQSAKSEPNLWQIWQVFGP